MSVVVNNPEDLTIDAILRVAFEGETVQLHDDAIVRMAQGRDRFTNLIGAGVPCYGVTTGLGKLVDSDLDEKARLELPHNILRARAAAIGEPMPKAVVRAMMLLKLGNLVSGADGTTPALASYICDRINDGFTPWVPSLGHGMAADAIAHTHCFQTLIGEGFVLDEKGDEKVPAATALAERNVEPLQLGHKEGLALLNGIAAAPAYALYGLCLADETLAVANAVVATSIEGAAAPKDAVDPMLSQIAPEPGIEQCLHAFNSWLAGSEISAIKLQAPISYRIFPQVHGALVDALSQLGVTIFNQARSFSDNPWMTDDNRFLSVGSFHNQHLVNQIEQVTLALVHAGCLSERRLHRLLDASVTGLNPQLAARPGLDAGLVVLHKAAIDHAAKLRFLATPVSVMTSETSAGQEDYMSMAIPAVQRLLDAVETARIILASELLAACVALDHRAEKPGAGVSRMHEWVRSKLTRLDVDRSPGPDLELLLEAMESDEFSELVTEYS